MKNPHFVSADSWRQAAALIDFEPLRPRDTGGREPESFEVYVRDYKKRELPRGARSLEVYFGQFSMSQSRKGEQEARRWALGVSYGRAARGVAIAGHEGRAYDLGPEPEADDIDPRMPAVVTWCDGPMFYLLASDSMQADELLPIAESCYRDRRKK